MMNDDGIFVNLEIGETPIRVKQNFRGGRWRDRLIAKKCAAKRLNRGNGSLHPSTREIFNKNQHEQSNGHQESEETIISAKRRRKDHEVLDKSNFTNINNTKWPKSHGSNRGVLSEDSAKNPQNKVNSKLDKNSNPHDNARSAFISGKLPAGSINIDSASRVYVNKEPDSLEDQLSTFKAANLLEKNAQYLKLDKPKKKVFEDVNHLDHHDKTVGSRDNPMPKKSGQIISSLFSYNPSSKSKYEEPDQDPKIFQPSNAPLATEIDAFVAMGLSPRVATHLSTKLGIEAPTAIQKVAIPVLIKGEDDAFIQAETGSGKTFAYLLPIVERIIAISSQGFQINRNSGLFAIVLAPTRELCKQIETVLGKLLRCAPWIVGTTVIGGESKQSEKARIRKGINILIATPGRLSDHLKNTEALKVSSVRWLVLDEGDRLMELGFEDEIRQIVEKITGPKTAHGTPNYLDRDSLPKKRVTILCSATMKMNVQRLGEISLKDAIHIVADPAERIEKHKQEISESSNFSAPAQLKQAYAIVPAKLRLVTLTAVLKKAFNSRGSVMKVIVFISCADSVDFHFSVFSSLIETSTNDGNKTSLPPAVLNNELTKDTVAYANSFSSNTNNVTLYRLHGSLAQNVRSATLKAFTASKEPCLMLCTDVASRGLDLPNIDFVIEYDPPFCADDHLHRVGRTARAGRDGRALILLLPGDEEEYVSILASNYKEGKNALTPNTAEFLLHKGFGGVGKEWEDRATNWQLNVERWVQDSPKYLDMARRGFQSHIRAYATHVAGERHIFNIQTLHLGHLAKAFALRDKPSSIKVPGLRSSKKMIQGAVERNSKSKQGDRSSGGERVRKQKKLELNLPKVDSYDAYKLMNKKAQELNSNEFNII